MSKLAQVITVDGPSGSGKGTLALRLARELGWHFLDSGALYRLVALAALKHDVPLDDESALSALAEGLAVEFHLPESGELQVLLEGENVTHQLRLEETGNAASKVAPHPGVRQALLERQRRFQQPPGLVADGRDMGTVVFPQAELKIFLTASAEVRGERRYKQLKEKGVGANLADLVREIAERDERDANRKVSPLKPAEDAVIVDSSDLGIDEVFELVLKLVRQSIEI